jgi:hypothetical protein
VKPLHVEAYIEVLLQEFAKPTVKQHLAALRMLFDWLVVGHVMETNPAHSARGPKHVVEEGPHAGAWPRGSTRAAGGDRYRARSRASAGAHRRNDLHLRARQRRVANECGRLLHQGRRGIVAAALHCWRTIRDGPLFRH